MSKLRLGFLASHGGSNMQSIIDACKAGTVDAVPAVVISNNSKAGALERARTEGIPHYHISTMTVGEGKTVDSVILEKLHEHGADLLILAGYMKIVSPELIRGMAGKVLNIHPALLPQYGGKGMYGHFVHEAVVAAKEEFSGPTVHLVDEKYDHGRILAQQKVPVLPDDTPQTLAARVLEEEHKIYPATIQKIASGEIVL